MQTLTVPRLDEFRGGEFEIPGFESSHNADMHEQILHSDFLSTAEADNVISSEFIKKNQSQRIGLKTAEGGQRVRHPTCDEKLRTLKAFCSNGSINMDNRFQGFDRLQTHNNMVQ